MHPAELAILLHRALEVRLAKLLELLDKAGWTEDMEQLHQVRVAARRLVAVLDLVDAENYPGHKGQRRALKSLVDLLGLPRELDVHSEALQAHHREAGTSTQAAVLEYLLERVDRDRAKARRAMAKGLERLRLPDLERLLEVPALQHPFQSSSLQEAAWACLAPRLQAALGKLAELGLRENPEAMHRNRIQIKKLRYALEALESAFAAAPEAPLKVLRSLQTVLGDHHDLAALEALLWGLEGPLQERSRPTLRAGLLDLLGTVAEARREAFDRFSALAVELGESSVTLDLRRSLGLPPLDGGWA